MHLLKPIADIIQEIWDQNLYWVRDNHMVNIQDQQSCLLLLYFDFHVFIYHLYETNQYQSNAFYDICWQFGLRRLLSNVNYIFILKAAFDHNIQDVF